MQLTLYTDYALRVLIYLGRMPKESATLSEIAQFYQISRNHLVKVAHHLSKNDYIKTTRGKGGGMKLARPMAQINIGEVVRNTEPNFCMVECFSIQNNQCTITPNCHLKGVLRKGLNAFFAEMNNYTLADVAPPVITVQIEAAFKQAQKPPLSDLGKGIGVNIG